MTKEDGSTLMELLTVLAVAGVLVAVAVPGAAAVRTTFAADAAAERLALVLRAAQSRAQARAIRVQVTVHADGRFVVREAGTGAALPIGAGELGAQVDSNFPGGVVEFARQGWPCLPGAATPRAGRFTVAGGSPGHSVVLQLAGCVRCV